MKKLRKINWKAVGNAAIETIRSIARGDILLRMRVDKLFPCILYVFVLSWISIWLSYKVEQTMLKAENNKKTIEYLKINHAKKTCEIVGLTRISTVETMLLEVGSEIKAPDKPADILK